MVMLEQEVTSIKLAASYQLEVQCDDEWHKALPVAE